MSSPQGTMQRRSSLKPSTPPSKGVVRSSLPVFAVGRAQELMIVLEEYIRTGIIDNVPVYIDGMIWEANAIHTARPEYLSKDLRDQIFHMGHNPFISDIFHKVNGMDERREIVEGKPSIILSTSGMLTGGNSLEYFSGCVRTLTTPWSSWDTRPRGPWVGGYRRDGRRSPSRMRMIR